MKQKFLFIILAFVLLSSCDWESEVETNQNDLLDQQLSELLIQVSGNQSIAYFMLPESDEYEKIPQDPKNPLSRESVRQTALP